jgi:hypothetical protein
MKEVPVTSLMTAEWPELGHVRVLDLQVAEVRPSPENNELYRPVDPTEPEIVARRRAQAAMAGLETEVVGE